MTAFLNVSAQPFSLDLSSTWSPQDTAAYSYIVIWKYYPGMAYEKPKLVDLTTKSETGYGQTKLCESGSSALGICDEGFSAGIYCTTGSNGEIDPTPD